MRLVLTLTLVNLVFAHQQVMADANDGELFGFELGSSYQEQDKKDHDDGRLVLIATQSPVKPDAIDTVYVLVTPISRSIGKIAGESWYESGEDAIVSYERFRSILRSKYDNWESVERSEIHLQGTQFTDDDYMINLQVSGPHRDSGVQHTGKPFQFVLSISYKVASASATEFELMANEEIKNSKAAAFKDSDTRGL